MILLEWCLEADHLLLRKSLCGLLKYVFQSKSIMFKLISIGRKPYFFNQLKQKCFRFSSMNQILIGN